MKIVVYKIILGDGTLANLDERRLDGIYLSSGIEQQIERIRAENGNENRLIFEDKKSAILHYKKFKFVILEVWANG